MIASLLLASVTTLGVNVGSVHERPGFNNTNPGVYAVTESGYAGGAYLNSHERVSVWVARKWETAPVSIAGARVSAAVLAGAITGYERVSPLVSPSIAVHGESVTYRVSFAPRHPTKPGAAAAVHLSLEFAR